jgi:hypothetical protein
VTTNNREMVRTSRSEDPASISRSVSPGEPRWRALIGSIRALRMEVKRLAPERSIGLAGNPAAPESAIRVAELRLGRQLPPSYREFLSFSDGWSSFFESADLLGTGEIGRYPSTVLRHDSRHLPAHLLAFGADRNGTSLFAFDTSVRSVDGELPVIAWVGGLGLDCRCFTSFLAMALQICRAELATLKTVTVPASGLRRRPDMDAHPAETTDVFDTASPNLPARTTAGVLPNGTHRALSKVG